jgi:hypothetical protein
VLLWREVPCVGSPATHQKGRASVWTQLHGEACPAYDARTPECLDSQKTLESKEILTREGVSPTHQSSYQPPTIGVIDLKMDAVEMIAESQETRRLKQLHGSEKLKAQETRRLIS